MSLLAAVAEDTQPAGDSSRSSDLREIVVRMLASAPGASMHRAPDALRELANGLPAVLSTQVGCNATVGAALHEGSDAIPLVAQSRGVILAADATLIRREELGAALHGAADHTPGDADDGALLLAAWSTWGEGMTEHVHGDIALVLLDSERRTLFVWRDFVGRRPLYWSELPGGVAVASSVASLVAHPDVPRKLDRLGLAASAGALFEHPDETAWESIRTLPPGHVLLWKAGSRPQLRRVWHPPRFESGPSIQFDEAAEELQRLILLAVGDRMAGSGHTAVWLSGGWDSPAVYGAAVAHGGERVVPVSMSYPPGDRGREDESILTIAAHHSQSVSWASVEEAPLVEAEPIAESAGFEQPFVHPYRIWNRRLAEVTRSAGASVALDGAGGDQLFGLTPVFLAELLRRGRLVSAVREAARHGTTGGSLRSSMMAWWMWGVRPLLSPGALSLAGLVRGGRVPLGHLERPIPPWLTVDGEPKDALRRRARGWSPGKGETLGAAESRWYLTSPYAGRILAAQSAAAMEGGVTLLSPLLDERLIRFAATRPREERAGGGETKRLLRSATSEWLPPELLRKRASRTGLSTDYFRRELRRHLPSLLTAVGGLEALEGIGVVSGSSFRESAAEWLAGRASDEVGLALLCTARTELWVRARL